MNVYFDICINDQDGNGISTRHLRAAAFRPVRGDFDDELHLECTGEELFCDRVAPDTLKVGAWNFPILGYRAYVGNMAWDSVMVTRNVANMIARVLRKSGAYAPDSGTEELWNAWDSGQSLFPAEGE